MAQEAKRGCGYRKVGGIYLVGGYVMVPCDRLPLQLDTCPCCGEGIKFSRAPREINPHMLWGEHLMPESIEDYSIDRGNTCSCEPNCFVCYPPDTHNNYIIWIGEKHYKTPADFMKEAGEMGISRRIKSIPKNLKVGESVVYFAHIKAIECEAEVEEPLENGQARLMNGSNKEYKPGIITAFIPSRIEKLIWESEATDETLKDLDKRGITPVIIKDGDKDHMPTS